MRVLVLQFVPDVRGRTPRYDPQLAVLIALLRERGYEVSLAALARFDETALRRALAAALPRIIYADIHPVCGDAAQRTLGEIARREFLPIVAGGALASVAPQRCLSMPGVEAAALGEPDASLITYFERLRDPALRPTVPGVWRREDAGQSAPAMPGLVEDLDSLPLGERTLFSEAEFIRAGGQLEIMAGRGSSRDLGYTLNATLRDLYGDEDRANWVRWRTIDGVIEEASRLRRDFEGVRTVRFLDRDGPGDAEWLDEFIERWPGEVGLPFRCHAPRGAAEGALLRRLAAAGCYAIDVDVISGSEMIRDDVFSMDESGDFFEALIAGVRDCGMHSRALLLAGAPYESEESLLAAEALLERLRPDEIDARPYYPIPGTAAAALCRENGWLHPRGEERFHQQQCGIVMPACPSEAIERAVRRLNSHRVRRRY